MGNKLDRPAALTPKVQTEIVDALASGNYLSTACLAAGITVETFYYWKRLCESGAEHAQKYFDFFSSVKRASATAELAAISDLRRGAPGWQANAWFLERRFVSRWAKRDIVVVQTQKRPEEMTDAELDQARKQVRRKPRT